jgi:hypothetical protein
VDLGFGGSVGRAGSRDIGVPSNHTNLVKFGNGSDKYYLQDVQQINECIAEIREIRAIKGRKKRR